MDLQLDDDLCGDFKGTLQLTEDDKNCGKDNSKIVNNGDLKNSSNETETENQEQRNNLISSITFIPKQLKETIWSSGSKENDLQKQDTNNVVQSVAPVITGKPTDFFTFRENVVEHAINECTEQLVDDKKDGPLLSTFLITEISLWDTDKERLILLTSNTMIIVKYDFIALKRLECRKIPLESIDTMIIGDLIYPPASLVPQLQGLVDGLFGVINRFLFDKCSKPKDKQLLEFFQASYMYEKMTSIPQNNLWCRQIRFDYQSKKYSTPFILQKAMANHCDYSVLYKSLKLCFGKRAFGPAYLYCIVAMITQYKCERLPMPFGMWHNKKINRNTKGIRLMWNKGKPINFLNKWNPLSNEVPYVTLTSHPLLHHKVLEHITVSGLFCNGLRSDASPDVSLFPVDTDQLRSSHQQVTTDDAVRREQRNVLRSILLSPRQNNLETVMCSDCINENQRRMYDIDCFIDQMRNAITDLQRIRDFSCLIVHKDILLDTYVGIGSLIHNRNALGYFKVRGKLSF